MIRKIFWVVFFLFLLPSVVSLLVWQADTNKPKNWNAADWNSAGVLPSATLSEEAVVYVMAARTGRWKGALSVHSWLVIKQSGADRYTRYDVVGWGTPVRVNAYAADARWYSNEPEIIYSASGHAAEEIILNIERTIFSYPHGERGDYVIWPGPNSNSFIAHLLDQVPETGWVLPANAVGRNYIAEGRWVKVDHDWKNIQVSFNGYLGFAIGIRHGFEVHLLGLVAGFDFNRLAIKLPGFGNLGV